MCVWGCAHLEAALQAGPLRMGPTATDSQPTAVQPALSTAASLPFTEEGPKAPGRGGGRARAAMGCPAVVVLVALGQDRDQGPPSGTKGPQLPWPASTQLSPATSPEPSPAGVQGPQQTGVAR